MLSSFPDFFGFALIKSLLSCPPQVLYLYTGQQCHSDTFDTEKQKSIHDRCERLKPRGIALFNQRMKQAVRSQQINIRVNITDKSQHKNPQRFSPPSGHHACYKKNQKRCQEKKPFYLQPAGKKINCPRDAQKNYKYRQNLSYKNLFN